MAQITAENVGAPATGVTIIGVGFFFVRWLTNTVITKMDLILTAIQEVKTALNSFSRAHERALFLNTQATMLMGIAQDESSASMKEKLRACLKDLEEAEAQRLKRTDDGRG